MRLESGWREEYEVEYLLSDFKKKNGYKRSIELIEGYMDCTGRIIVDVIFSKRG